MPVAPHDQQLFLGRGGGSCWEAAAVGVIATATEDAGADVQLTGKAGAEAETEGPACCEASVCEGPAFV